MVLVLLLATDASAVGGAGVATDIEAQVLAAQQLMQTDPAAAAARIDAIASAAGGHPGLRLLGAQLAAERSDWIGAERRFRKLLGVIPGADVSFGLGVALEHLGDVSGGHFCSASGGATATQPRARTYQPGLASCKE